MTILPPRAHFTKSATRARRCWGYEKYSQVGKASPGMKAPRGGAWLLIAAVFSSLHLVVEAFSTSPQKPPEEPRQQTTTSSSIQNALASSWKAFYEASELRLFELTNDSRAQLQQLQAELEESQSQMEITVARANAAESKLDQIETIRANESNKNEECRKQFLSDILALQEERDRLELRWAEECERSKVELATLQSQYADELRQVQDDANVLLQTTVADYGSKLKSAEERLRHLHMTVADQERMLTKQADYVQVLETERRSLRILLQLSLSLVRQRVANGIDRLVHPFRSGRAPPPNGGAGGNTRISVHNKKPKLTTDRDVVAPQQRGRSSKNGGFP
jgi:uncharacterized coiled-coil protein SlyX